MSLITATDKVHPEQAVGKGRPELHRQNVFELLTMDSQQAFDLLQGMALAVKDTAEKIRKATGDVDPEIVIRFHPQFATVTAQANETG